jgi:hypothetical protein
MFLNSCQARFRILILTCGGNLIRTSAASGVPSAGGTTKISSVSPGFRVNARLRFGCFLGGLFCSVFRGLWRVIRGIRIHCRRMARWSVITQSLLQLQRSRLDSNQRSTALAAVLPLNYGTLCQHVFYKIKFPTLIPASANTPRTTLPPASTPTNTDTPACPSPVAPTVSHLGRTAGHARWLLWRHRRERERG